jgi:Conserved hypothetical protein (DUF2461)
MSSDDAGWPEEAYTLLRRLECDRSPEALHALRGEHDRLVRRPMEELCRALGVVGGYGRAWPSARSSSPATWLRTAAAIWVARRVHMTARFDVDGLRVEGGWTSNDTDQLWRYRAKVDDDRVGGELVEVVADLDQAGYALNDDRLTRMPRRYAEDHPRAELIRRRTVIARRDLGTGAWLHTAEVVDRVRVAFDGLLPLTSWLVDHVAT